MSNLFIKNSKFIYQGKEGEQILMDFSTGLNNKSSISLHRLSGQTHLTIPDLLISMLEQELENGNGWELPFAIIDILLANQLMKTSQPVRLLEYGSGQGALSFHLAKLLGIFHEKSNLVCAYDTIEPKWMEQIAKVKQLPKLSFFAGDFGALQLQKDFFDIVLINGMINYAEPHRIISDAIRLAIDHAVIICYISHTPYLESTFKLFFEQREEYEITSSIKIMLANVKNKCWDICKNINVTEQALKHIEQAKTICSEKRTEKNIYYSMVNTLKQDIKNAAEIGDVELKLKLLSQKETLIQYILNQ